MVYHIQQTFGDKQKINFMLYRKSLEQKKRDATTGSDPKAGRLPTTGSGDDTNPTINIGIKEPFRQLEENQKEERGGNVIRLIRMTPIESQLQTTTQLSGIPKSCIQTNSK